MSGVTPKLLQKWGFNSPVRGLKVTCIGRHHYKATSQSRPEIEHTVDTEGEFPECDCEDYQMNKNLMCKHLRRVGLLADAGLLPKHKSANK